MLRKGENEQTVKETLVKECTGFIKKTTPRSSEQKRLAKETTNRIYNELLRCKEKLVDNSGNKPKGVVEKTYLKFAPWLYPDQFEQPDNEEMIYMYYTHFLLFIARALKKYLNEEGYHVSDAVFNRQAKLGEFIARYIGPCLATNCKAAEAEDFSRIDVGMDVGSLSQRVRLQPHPDNRIMFGLMEAKLDVKDQQAAYEQLYRYIRQILQSQIHRRYTYGLTCCATIVRVCLFGTDNVFASETIDVSTKEGQWDFIEFFTNWSLCDYDQLGYDSTMSYTGQGLWHVEVPNSTDGNQKGNSSHFATYVVDESIVDADKLLGRHTKCLLGYKLGDPEKKGLLLKIAGL